MLRNPEPPKPPEVRRLPDGRVRLMTFTRVIIQSGTYYSREQVQVDALIDWDPDTAVDVANALLNAAAHDLVAVPLPRWY
jgi:hypothetical protein